MSMRVADVVVAAIIIIVGLVVGLDSLRLGGGWGPEGPRAGFFPFLMATVVVLGCAWVIWQALRGKGTTAPDEPFVLPGGLRPVLMVFLPAAVMVLLTEIVGLYVAAAIYLAAYIRWVGDFRWSVVLAVSVLVPAAFYVLFDKIFLIPMPQGMFGHLLGF